ncbi:Dihydrolipoyl dehydrogenase [Candidatus Erwinia haradaeae]|uniref:Dihydrolipoyl dehydrogenase n=2 Tax=Candidatus Erwinia haradaeae TaxID=1922217 RepID=A0A451D9T4_9GAMM|nr:Dihydrolipoyl dehydrogenase [Candidatus Erwinia haradaeae]
MSTQVKTQIVLLGAGPAGYSAAFRAADLGLQTIIVERYKELGGVCLNVGCIPSKALLHISQVIEETKALDKHGVVFNDLQIDIDKIRNWKTQIISRLTSGLSGMAQSRKVQVIQGIGSFTDSHTLEVISNNGSATTITFDHAIIATGSSAMKIPLAPYEDPRIWDSTTALALKTIPERLLIIGGGIIGLEMGSLYHTLGSQVDIVEMSNQLIPPADLDVVQCFTKSISKRLHIMLETQVIAITTKSDGVHVTMADQNASISIERYDAVLVAIGRTPNGKNCSADKAGVQVDERGFIHVDKQMRTNIPHIFAIGDVVGQPMLAHKGIHEGHIAAEVISGKNYYFEPQVIPSIAYTEPEVAWVGITEKAAKKQGIPYKTSIFPWSASGRALASNCANGMTKLIFDQMTHRVIGGAVVGTMGGELLGELTLAIEMGCDAADIALTIHAHPTLHESVGLAAEIFEGSITDILNPTAHKTS